MSANREQILAWLASGHLEANKLEQALAITNSAPSAAAQFRFLRSVVLVFAVLLLCCGVVFFFAYNWNDLSRYGKLAIAQGALILSLLPLLRVQLQHPVGQASMFAASLLVGALLAVLGQSYQTGADQYQLFLIWAILISPWVLLARSPSLWLLLLALLNLSLVLLLNNFAIYHLIAPFNHPGWLVFALNTSAAGLWMSVTQRFPSRPMLHWAERSINLYSLLIITYLTIEAIYAAMANDGLSLPIWISCSALWLYLYRRRQLDLVMLAALLLATITLVAAVLIKTLSNQLGFAGLFLTLALTVMGLSSAGAVWLRRLNQQAPLSGAGAIKHD